MCKKKILQRFRNKNLGKYHDLHVESDTLLLPDVFGKFRNMCLKIYELDSAKLDSFSSSISMPSSFVKE